MKMSCVGLVASLVLVMGLALTPCVVVAGDRQASGGVARPVGPVVPGPRGGTISVGPVVPRPFMHPFGRPFIHPSARPFGFGPFFPGQFVSFDVGAPPVIGYAPPTVLSMPPPIVYVQPPPVVMVTPPSPPPTPSVIEYPNGRYELRGDGITTPYTWAWIPNAPPPPPGPPGALPTVPPAAPSDVPGNPHSKEQRPSAQLTETYRWTDERGVTTWTDRIDKIPEQYRAQTKRVF